MGISSDLSSMCEIVVMGHYCPQMQFSKVGSRIEILSQPRTQSICHLMCDTQAEVMERGLLQNVQVDSLEMQFQKAGCRFDILLFLPII